MEQRLASGSPTQLAQERVEQRPDGLVRITLKKAYNDGTIAVDMTRCRCCGFDARSRA